MMRRKLPSNASLIAFDAAARHGSFSRAADELALTEGAISRQIARLESFLGVSLFERTGNRVRLLPNGQRYASQVAEILDRLERDSQFMMGQTNDGASLNLAIIPTFAVRWLLPRLKTFKALYPNISVHLTEKLEPFVLSQSNFDAAIHYVHPAWAGMHTQELFDERLIPVCSPCLLQSYPSHDLNDMPLLHRRQNPNAWQLYARETGVLIANPSVGSYYDLHSMTIEAALAGLGVALVPAVYVERELKNGLLLSPWKDSQTVIKTFCAVLPEPLGMSSKAVQCFINWIKEESQSNEKTS
ncbi:LysR substrate-binding domain-containing protein [Vibrio salinus]|uniref:LysR substrate-binding domain-containing protein n=1 Tax=Vibrio salinus TaxID=2899784 RepID=UPI001E562B31|nr:LysR substrate-binding domain-containing protein [Vibrio salinus]MCE0495556.1 LysR substrate-binding domain-containing protein [Vibrio salinus]